ILSFTVAVSCDRAPENSAGSLEADVAAIRTLHAEWIVAETSGDLERFMALWSDDGVLMPPNVPTLIGKDAMREWLRGFYNQFTVSIETVIDDIVLTGDWAYVRWTTIAITLTPKDGGMPITRSGKALWILKRQADGNWKLAYDIWNSDKPSTPKQ
ncbi:YybH family protein, partial [Candidatus Latescibacterota bacterium]